jgi:hypothetical protein
MRPTQSRSTFDFRTKKSQAPNKFHTPSDQHRDHATVDPDFDRYGGPVSLVPDIGRAVRARRSQFF